MICTVAVGFVGFKIAKKLKAPAPAMIGSMIAVGITNIAFDYAYLPVVIKNFTQVITCAFIGVQIKKHDLLQLKSVYKPAILLIIILTLNTFRNIGRNVSKGERIATVGSTGYSTGPHLHLEWWHKGRYADPLMLWDTQ